MSSLYKMKNYRFQNPNNKGSISRLHSKPEPAKIQKQASSSNRSQAEREKKRLELQKEMKMLEGKIKDKDSTIKQTGKLLDIDDFLKKQKEKTKEYALKLNEEYQKQKKDREVKLYKKYGRQDVNSQKLITGTIKSQIPLNIFTAIDQLKQKNSNIDKWVSQGHYHKLDDLLIDKNCDLFSDSLKQQQQNCLKATNENSWKRIKEVSSNQSQIRYFPVKIEQNQLQPSDSCEALMAALNLVPPQLSQYLYRQGQGVNKQIYFSLKFFPGGEARTVFTDQWIEVRQFKHKYVNISSRHKNQLTFWSTLLDKSFRKLHLGQKSLKNINQTLLTVFGIDGQIIPFSNKSIIKENFSKIMNFLLTNVPKALIGFMNDRSDTPDRIFPLQSVSFPVLANKKKKKGELVQQQSPKSQQQQYNVMNPYTTLLKSDYINKFTITELCQYFNKIVFIRDYPDKWGGNRIKMQFLSNGPISFTGSQWLKNNQYSFTLAKSVEVRIAMRRGWGRVPETTQNIQQQKLNYGFILFRSNDGQTQISCMKLQNLIGKCKRSDLNGAILSKLLEKGTYVVIPFSHIVSQQYMQSFNLDILIEKEEALTINKAKIYEYYYDNKNTQGDKIVQKLQSRIKYQRAKFEKISPPKISLHSKKKGIQDQLESLNLILKGQTKIIDFPIPGKLQSFLVFGQINEQKRQRKEVKSGQQQQIEKYERQQWLRTLLGYDSMSGQDINIGQMREIAEQTSDTLDFNDFELTDQGFMALLETLMVLPRISTLKLDRNSLTDSSITYLCYYLEKGNRNQLKKLSLNGNKIGASGIRALQGLKKRLVNLQVSGVKI